MTARALRLAAIAAALSLAAASGAAAQDTPPGMGGGLDALAVRVAEARDLFRHGKYEEAARRFHQFEDEIRYPAEVSQECYFSEAECFRLRREYPHAVDIYAQLLKRFPDTLYRERVLEHLYEIASYWLEDTRAEMKQAKDSAEGKGPPLAVRLPQWDKSKPTVGRERRALNVLSEIWAADPNGPLAERCLFTQAGIKYFRNEYGAAGRLYEELADRFPRGPLAYPALKYAVLSRAHARGAIDKVEEVRKLVERTRHDYPAQAAADGEFFAEQIKKVEAEQKKK